MAVAFPTDLLPLPVRDGFEDGLQNPFSRFNRAIRRVHFPERLR
ncbi:hypothetical protein [Achromobacter phage ewik_TL4]|nr:hypothetical protein [Achromobacter phage ewik_TL4]